jgi:flagellar motor switch protein FliG
MQMTRSDWFKLRYALTFLVVVTLSVVGLLYSVESQKIQTRQAVSQQESLLLEATQRFKDSGNEKSNIIKFLPQYQQLINEGAIGEERRIDWVDKLRTIHKENKLFSIKYSIAAQENYVPNFNLDMGPFKMQRSVMKIELAMLHEGDLITLLESLSHQQSAPFMIRLCEIQRLSPSLSMNLVPNMQAKCELDWITIHDPIAAVKVLMSEQKEEAHL